MPFFDFCKIAYSMFIMQTLFFSWFGQTLFRGIFYCKHVPILNETYYDTIKNKIWPGQWMHTFLDMTVENLQNIYTI